MVFGNNDAKKEGGGFVYKFMVENELLLVEIHERKIKLKCQYIGLKKK